MNSEKTVEVIDMITDHSPEVVIELIAEFIGDYAGDIAESRKGKALAAKSVELLLEAARLYKESLAAESIDYMQE